MAAHTPVIELLRCERLVLKQRRRVLKMRERLEENEDILRALIQASVLARAATNLPADAGDDLPSRDGEAPRDTTARGVDDPERGPTVARSGGPGRQSTASSVPGDPPAASAEQLAPSGTAGVDSGGSGAATSTGALGSAPEAGSTPEPAGSSRVLIHDDLCGARLAPDGLCPACGFYPDAQSTAFVVHVPGATTQSSGRLPDDSKGGDADDASDGSPDGNTASVAPRADSTSAKRGRQPHGDPRRFHPGFKDETGNRYGELVVVRRAANVNGNARWHCRCDRGHERILDGIRLRADGDKTLCLECSGKAPKTCSFCGEAGHTSAGCPERPGTAKHRQVRQTPRRDDCPTCKSMSSRVEGPRCPDCGLEAEAPPRAEDFTSSGVSGLGRAV